MLGLTAYTHRRIQPKRAYSHLIGGASQLAFTDPVINPNGDVDYTVAQMLAIVRKHYTDTTKLAKSLEGRTLYATLENIWNFVYNHIQYVPDSQLFEQLRRPLRTLHDQQGDCDCYSILIGSILYNLGIPFRFRITKYDGKAEYQHVYVIVPYGSRNEYFTVDPVVERFNYEKPFTAKKDFDMNALNGMPIQFLNGIGNSPTPDYQSLAELITGKDLEAVNGLGDAGADDAMYKYLLRTREAIMAHPQDFTTMSDPRILLEMYDYAIRYWNSDKRQEALDVLAAKEEQLIAQGLLKLPEDLQGIAAIDDDDAEWEADTQFTGVEPEDPAYYYRYVDGLNGEGIGRLKIGKKVGGFFKKTATAVKKGTKAIVKAVVRFNPATAIARGAFLKAVKKNYKGLADRLQWYYISEEEARKMNRLDDWKENRDNARKGRDMFLNKLQGKDSNLRDAVMSGRKNPPTEDNKGIEGLAGLGVISELVSGIIEGIVGLFDKDKRAARKADRAKSEAERDAAIKSGQPVPEKESFWNKLTNSTSTETSAAKASAPTSSIAPATKSGSMAPATTPTKSGGASIVPTGIISNAINFVKENPVKVALVGAGLALALSPKLQTMVGLRKAKPGGKRPAKAAEGLSGTATKRRKAKTAKPAAKRTKKTAPKAKSQRRVKLK